MTNLKCLATGSSGNCYLLNVGSSTILLDAGIPIEKITANTNINSIDFAFISHEHKDHSLSTNKLVLRGVKILDGITNQEVVKSQINAKNGGLLRVWQIPVHHGSTNNNALVVKTDEECVLYATDFNICDYDLSDFKFTRVIVECNYIDKLLPQDMDFKTRRQINTHMGLNGLMIFLDKLDLSKCQELDLIHMSQGYGDSVLMGAKIYAKYRIRTGVCKQFGGIEYYGG